MKKLQSLKNMVFTFFAMMMCLVFFSSFLCGNNVMTVSAENNNSAVTVPAVDDTTTKEIISYTDVFNYYYNKVRNKYFNIQNVISLEEFIKKYYSQNKSIKDFSESFEEEDFLNINSNITSLQCNKYKVNDSSEIQLFGEYLQILSPDEDYILGMNLGDESYTSSSYFKRQPIYEAVDYSEIRNGDIIYESASKSAAKHAAFIYNTYQDSDYGSYIQTIEAVASGVNYGVLDDERMTRFGVSIFRVYRAGELGVVTKARNFVKAQIGKSYSLDYSKRKTDFNSSSWYCSELVFASYYSGGMNICSNRDFNFEPETMPCMPLHLTKGMLTMLIYVDASYLLISIDKFTDGWWNSACWSVSITNLNYYDVNVEYNTKMCNTGDAQNWTNLSDIKAVEVKKRSSVQVDISQNWFATSIAVSYVKDGFRYVTYGTDLSKVDYSINISNSKINI